MESKFSKCEETCSGHMSEDDSKGVYSFNVYLSFDQSLTSATGFTGTTGITGSALAPLSIVTENIDRVYGNLKLKFNRALSKLAYKLYIWNATSRQNQITMASLNLGNASVIGPSILPIYMGPSRSVNGLLAEGTLTNVNVTNTYVTEVVAINTIASVYSAIREGRIYASVQTNQYPDGLLRGQIYNNCV